MKLGEASAALSKLSPEQQRQRALVELGLDHAINERKVLPFEKPVTLDNVGITSKADVTEARQLHTALQADRVAVGLHQQMAARDNDKGVTHIHDPRTDDPRSIYSTLDALIPDDN